MSMAPEAGLLLEIYLDGAAPTLNMITSLPQGQRLRVWDPKREQMAFVFHDARGRLRIQTGDLEKRPEEYDIVADDALADALELWNRAKIGEARQAKDYIEQGAF